MPVVSSLLDNLRVAVKKVVCLPQTSKQLALRISKNSAHVIRCHFFFHLHEFIEIVEGLRAAGVFKSATGREETKNKQRSSLKQTEINWSQQNLNEPMEVLQQKKKKNKQERKTEKHKTLV